MRSERRQAIVIGASMGGMLAALVLAERFESVLVLERDTLSALDSPRQCLPQARHTHVLKSGGRVALEQLLPGVTEQLLARGALSTDALADVRRFQGGGFYSRSASDLRSIFMSRPLLDATVFDRLRALPNVRLASHCYVQGLETSADRERVVGVRVSRRGEGRGGGEEVLRADLVVDATGRASRTPSFLASLGYPVPAEEEVRVRLGFATRLYRREPGDLAGLKGVVIAPTPDNLRGGAMLAQEGDRWIVTIGGYLGDHAPTEEKGFVEFAASLPTPDIFEVVRRAEPLGDPFGTKFPANRRYRYEHLARFPAGLLVVGDAICSFNPFSGQGITVCSLQALILRDCLRRDPRELAPEFFSRAARVIDSPWQLTVADDQMLIEPGARRSLPDRLFQWYMGRANVAARHDPGIALALLRASDLLASPRSVLHPRVALRMLIPALARRTRGRAVAARTADPRPAEPSPTLTSTE